jgi:hypothetical protein
VLTGVVVAEEREAAAVARAAAPRSSWTGLDLRGIEVVKLSSLWSLLAGRELGLEAIDRFTPLHEETEEGPWVYRLPPDLSARLADLSAIAAAPVAEAWAATGELALEGWDAATAGAVLGELGTVARAARDGDKPLLLWMSL